MERRGLMKRRGSGFSPAPILSAGGVALAADVLVEAESFSGRGGRKRVVVSSD